eukprot:scaffold199548_cov37-Tisochrysis_lutea.AAC.1
MLRAHLRQPDGYVENRPGGNGETAQKKNRPGRLSPALRNRQQRQLDTERGASIPSRKARYRPPSQSKAGNLTVGRQATKHDHARP